MVRFEGLVRAELVDAMFHQACASWDLDLTAIQIEILPEMRKVKNLPRPCFL